MDLTVWVGPFVFDWGRCIVWERGAWHIFARLRRKLLFPVADGRRGGEELLFCLEVFDALE